MQSLKSYLKQHDKIILLFFLLLTYCFTIWQLDLIRDQFVRQAILLGDFYKVLWETEFGFPPFCWFGIWFPLQVSFDMMYFLQAIVVFAIASMAISHIIPFGKRKKPSWIGVFLLGFGIGLVLWDLYDTIISAGDTPFRLHHGYVGILFVLIAFWWFELK